MDNLDQKKMVAPKINELICKLKEVQLGLQSVLSILFQKMENLDSEPELLNKLQLFKKDVESQARNLELEVNILHEQLKTIKELLYSDTKKTPVEY